MEENKRTEQEVKELDLDLISSPVTGKATGDGHFLNLTGWRITVLSFSGATFRTSLR